MKIFKQMNIPITPEEEPIEPYELIDYLNIPYGPLILEFRDVPGYEEFYKVSNYGTLISKQRVVTAKYKYKSGLVKAKSIPKKEFIRTLTLDKGYWATTLSNELSVKKTKLHRIMCIAFIPNIENKPHVNHKNCVRDDKFISNLEWVTPKENSEHAVKYSKAFANRNLVESKRKLSISQVYEITYLLSKKNYSQRKIGELYNVSMQTISAINSGVSMYLKSADYIQLCSKLNSPEQINNAPYNY